MSTLIDNRARALRDRYGVPFAVARKLIAAYDLETAVEMCLADHVRHGHGHAPDSHATPRVHETSYILAGTCTVCGEIVDPVAARDFHEGPRLVVELTYAMEKALEQAVGQQVPPPSVHPAHDWLQKHNIEDRPLNSVREIVGDPFESDTLYLGRRADLDRLAGEFRNLGRTNSEHAAVARHAAHRIEAALKGTKP